MTPLEHFEEAWTRCAELSALHAYLASNVSGVLQPDELLRAEWVARVSALDLYMHELVAQRMLDTFEGRRLPTPAYFRFQVSTETLDRIRTTVNQSDAGSAFDLDVRLQLSYSTFQDPEKIAECLKLCSGIELWHEVALKLGATPPMKTDAARTLKKDLALIVRRRNKIAHEADLQPSPLREPWPISQADLVFVRDLIEKIVRAIDSAI